MIVHGFETLTYIIDMIDIIDTHMIHYSLCKYLY